MKRTIAGSMRTCGKRCSKPAPGTLDRLVAPLRVGLARRGGTRPGSLLRQSIPIRGTWTEGSSYTAPLLFLLVDKLVPPTFVETEPPVFGVILYSTIQDYVGRKARNVAVEENAEMDDSIGISVLDAFLGGLF